MSYIIHTTVLYKEGAEPTSPEAEWRQVPIVSPTFPPRGVYAIEEYSGTQKRISNPETASVEVGSSAEDALKSYQASIARLKQDGFVVYTPWAT